MVEVTFAQLHGWLVAFLWPFMRLSAFIMASPLWGHSSVPRQAKLGLVVLICVVISPTLPPMPDVPIMSWAGLGIMIEQLLIGAALGVVMHIILATVQAAGDFIALQMGLGFATFFSPDTGANTMILARILYMITLLMFLAVDGHLIAIEILADSFVTLPIGMGGLNLDAFDMLARFGSTIFEAGLLLALPVVAALLIINLSLGILNRSAPQLTVFNIGFPMSLTAGVFLLMVLMTDLGRFLKHLFEMGLGFMESLVTAMVPLS
ncbi:flagellar biosynthetic protein FliR [Onishia niordana]|uniref:flagellar biosynthetic protein FliR n=1 Tax=Onishia niordana TaxID=2508711 RepID=UPI00109EEA4D|nr:flagellar biosynthetic protein FliR [Halomonas niordiana]